MLSDIEIAQAATPDPIQDVAERIGIAPEYLIPYGHDKAKVDYNVLAGDPAPKAKLV